MKVKRVLGRNLENRKNTKIFQSRLDNPFDVNVSKSTFEDKRLKEGGCHETTYKSGIIEVPDTLRPSRDKDVVS